jgi:phosphoserine phosphatase
MRPKRVDLNHLYELMLGSQKCNYLIVTKDEQRFLRNIPSYQICLIIDWDDTLTGDIGSWQIMNNAFSKVGTTKDNILIEKIAREYHKIEKKRSLTDKEMKGWQRTNLEMYVERGLNLKCLNREMKKAKMNLSGAILLKYLLEKCSKVCIVSSGVKNVIEETLFFYGINPNKYGNLQINATNLFFNKKGVLESWDDNSIITAKKKPWIVHSFSRVWDIEHNNIFAVGDGNTDLNMLDLVSKQATMIFFSPSHKKELITMEKLNFISQKAHGFVKEDFNIITNFFFNLSEA